VIQASLLAVGDGVQWSRLVLEYEIKTKLRNFNNFFFLSDIFGGIFSIKMLQTNEMNAQNALKT
jgi:hypothetical protein